MWPTKQKSRSAFAPPDKIEIVEGLKGGETVVVEGNYALPDGTKVEPQMRKTKRSKRMREEGQCNEDSRAVSFHISLARLS